MAEFGFRRHFKRKKGFSCGNITDKTTARFPRFVFLIFQEQNIKTFVRVLFPFFQPFTNSDENLVLGYFDFSDFKNAISLALDRRFLELSNFPQTAGLEILIGK